MANIAKHRGWFVNEITRNGRKYYQGYQYITEDGKKKRVTIGLGYDRSNILNRIDQKLDSQVVKEKDIEFSKPEELPELDGMSFEEQMRLMKEKLVEVCIRKMPTDAKYASLALGILKEVSPEFQKISSGKITPDNYQKAIVAAAQKARKIREQT